MPTSEKQQHINVSEAFHLWNHLMQRYNTLFVTETMEMFVRDSDLKLILVTGNKNLNKSIKILEKEMMAYGIPLPVRPPKQTQTTTKIEEISDRHIYRRILRGIQSFLPTHTMAFVHSTTPKIRELFMAFLIDEMKIYASVLSDEDILDSYKSSYILDKNSNMYCTSIEEKSSSVISLNKKGIIECEEIDEVGLYGMEEKVLDDGSVWAKVFYHYNRGGTVLFTSNEEALHSNTSDKFSRLFL
jgi:hypothetical protein